MIAGFYNLTTIEDYDMVCVLDCRQAMSHNNNSSSLVELIEVFHNGSLIFGIEGICCFIEENEVGVLINCPGNEYSLFLSLA